MADDERLSLIEADLDYITEADLKESKTNQLLVDSEFLVKKKQVD